MSPRERPPLKTGGIGRYKLLLVPLDGSRLSETALPHAFMLATALESEIVLLRVVEQGSIGAALAGYEGPKVASRAYDLAVRSEKLKLAAAQRYLERHANLGRGTGLNVSVAAVTGDPAEQVLRFCEANAVDLVVMTTHGRSGVKRLVLGSVAAKIMRSPVVPVLVIR